MRLIDGKKQVELTEATQGIMQAAQAIDGLGKAVAALVPTMQKMGVAAKLIDQAYRMQTAFVQLEFLSGASRSEIKKHLMHSSRDIFGLLGFYARYGCFPCDCVGWGRMLIGICDQGFQWTNLDHLFWDKSPRLVQGVLLLVVIITMLLAAF